MKKTGFYCRVFIDGQTIENQLKALNEVAARHNDWTIMNEPFKDEGISGAKGREKRPGLDALLKAVARKELDVVACWSVDRLGRSTIDLLSFLRELHAKGVDLYLHQQGIDTTTPAGKAMFGMMGVFAEFERAMIQERVRAGLARAKAQGKRLGRPPVGPKVVAVVLERRAQGLGIRKIARALELGVGTVQKIVTA